MINEISRWLFDFAGVIGTIISIWPIIKMNHKDVQRITSVAGLANRDTTEIIPQIKMSWTGVALLVLTILAKLVYIIIEQLGCVQIESILVALLALSAATLATVLCRIFIINRYWKRYMSHAD